MRPENHELAIFVKVFHWASVEGSWAMVTKKPKGTLGKQRQS